MCVYKITENPKSDRGIDKISESDKSAKRGVCARKAQITSEYRCSMDRATRCVSQGTRCSKAFAASTDQSAHSTLCISSEKFRLRILFLCNNFVFLIK